MRATSARSSWLPPDVVSAGHANPFSSKVAELLDRSRDRDLCGDEARPDRFAGPRAADDGWFLMMDLKARLANRVRITTDGLHTYLGGSNFLFGADLDWAVLQKHYGQDPAGERRYSPQRLGGPP